MRYFFCSLLLLTLFACAEIEPGQGETAVERSARIRSQM